RSWRRSTGPRDASRMVSAIVSITGAAAASATAPSAMSVARLSTRFHPWSGDSRRWISGTPSNSSTPPRSEVRPWTSGTRWMSTGSSPMSASTAASRPYSGGVRGEESGGGVETAEDGGKAPEAPGPGPLAGPLAALVADGADDPHTRVGPVAQRRHDLSRRAPAADDHGPPHVVTR